MNEGPLLQVAGRPEGVVVCREMLCWEPCCEVVCWSPGSGVDVCVVVVGLVSLAGRGLHRA